MRIFLIERNFCFNMGQFRRNFIVMWLMMLLENELCLSEKKMLYYSIDRPVEIESFVDSFAQLNTFLQSKEIPHLCAMSLQTSQKFYRVSKGW